MKFSADTVRRAWAKLRGASRRWIGEGARAWLRYWGFEPANSESVQSVSFITSYQLLARDADAYLDAEVRRVLIRESREDRLGGGRRVSILVAEMNRRIAAEWYGVPLRWAEACALADVTTITLTDRYLKQFLADRPFIRGSARLKNRACIAAMMGHVVRSASEELSQQAILQRDRVEEEKFDVGRETIKRLEEDMTARSPANDATRRDIARCFRDLRRHWRSVEGWITDGGEAARIAGGLAAIYRSHIDMGSRGVQLFVPSNPAP